MAIGDVVRALGVVSVRDIFSFPLWWYSEGLFYTFKKLILSVQQQYARLALGIWIKNIFVPMYGQYDWQGRIISFFVRMMQVFFRAVVLIIWILFLIFVAGGYVIAPLLFLALLFLHAHLPV